MTEKERREAMERAELRREIREAEPEIYFGMLSIPREKWTEETKQFMAEYEQRYK